MRPIAPTSPPTRGAADWRSVRASAQEFRALPLRAHAILRDVPLHDIWRFRLRGGGPSRSVQDSIELFEEAMRSGLGLAPRALFALRKLLGRVFRWDEGARVEPGRSYVTRLTPEDRARSLDEPGSPSGLWTAVYRSETEAIGEVINRTVHAFLVFALEAEKDGDGYTLYLAIFVKPVSRFTPFYMALIDPFRHHLIYPALIRRVQRAWHSKWQGGP